MEENQTGQFQESSQAQNKELREHSGDISGVAGPAVISQVAAEPEQSGSKSHEKPGKKFIIRSRQQADTTVYWRRVTKKATVDAVTESPQSADIEAFQFDELEARRVARFLDKNFHIETEAVFIEPEETAQSLLGEIEEIINSNPGIIEPELTEGMIYALDYEIEGVYSGSVRDAQFEALAVASPEVKARSFDVLPSIELSQVEPGSFFEEGSKADQVWQILRPYVTERRAEYTIRGQTLARPVLIDEAGGLIAGIADCLQADSLNLNVQTYAIRFNQEVSDRDRAYMLVADAESIVNLPPKALAEVMIILHDNLDAQTGIRRGDGDPLTPDKEMSNRTGISKHKTERASTLARKMKGISQQKDIGSIPPSKAEQINERVSVAAKLIQRILDRFDNAETELHVRNRLRSELQQRLSVLCGRVKPPRGQK